MISITWGEEPGFAWKKKGRRVKIAHQFLDELYLYFCILFFSFLFSNRPVYFQLVPFLKLNFTKFIQIEHIFIFESYFFISFQQSACIFPVCSLFLKLNVKMHPDWTYIYFCILFLHFFSIIDLYISNLSLFLNVKMYPDWTYFVKRKSKINSPSLNFKPDCNYIFSQLSFKA